MYKLKLLSAVMLSSVLVACGGSGSSSGISNSSAAISSSSPAANSSVGASSVAASSVTATSSSEAAVSSSSEEASSSSEQVGASSSSETGASSSDTQSSEAASSSSSSAEIVNTPLPLLEDFDQVVDLNGFTGTGYKVLQTLINGEAAAFYHRMSGVIGFEDGAIRLSSNARFTLGNTTPTVDTASSDVLDATTGELDLSEAYRVSFCVRASNGEGTLQVFIDNNTSSAVNSAHDASSSRIYSQALSGLTVPQRVVLDRTVGTSTSFVQVRVDLAGDATIDDLWIGYQSDLSQEPSADDCADESSSSSSEASSSSSEESSSSSEETSSSSESSSSSAPAPDYDFEDDVVGEAPAGLSVVGECAKVSDEQARTGAQSVRMARVSTGVNCQLRKTLTRTETGAFKISMLIPEDIAQNVFVSLYDGSNGGDHLSIDVIFRPSGQIESRIEKSAEALPDVTYELGEWVDLEISWSDILVSRQYTLIINGVEQGEFTNNLADKAPDRFEIKYGVTNGAAESDIGIFIDTLTEF